MLNILTYASSFIGGLTLIWGLINWKCLDLLLRLLLVLTAIELITEICGTVYGMYYHNNMFIFNIYLFIELWLLGAVAFTTTDLPLYRRLIVAGVVVCTMSNAVCIWKMGIHVFANWGYLVEGIFLSIVFLSAFVRLFASSQAGKLSRNPKFWVYLGLLVYHGCNIPMFGILNYVILKHPAIALNVYIINDFLNIIRISFIAIAFFLQVKNHPNSSQLIPNDGQ